MCNRTKSEGKGCIWRSVCILGLFLTLADGLSILTPEPSVTTKWGKINGKWGQSTKGRQIASFLGIPYAQPPVGELRFRNPLPWNQTWDVLEAKTDKDVCPQFHFNVNIAGKEDCLHLNIHVPIIAGNQQLPVLVFVHGGAYMIGSGDSIQFAPDYLLDQDIILVTLNYRLHILGFFSTTNQAAPGNFGMKDVHMAFKWINENIASFLGDPNSVTAMGFSAGSATVHLLSLLDKSEGLFHRYILLSASVSSPWNVHPTETYRQTCLKAAKLVGCLPSKNASDSMSATNSDGENDNATGVSQGEIDQSLEEDEEMMNCMRKVDIAKLLATLPNFFVWHYHPACVFGPTLEDEAEGALLTEQPIKLLKEGKYRDIPAIMQVVSGEGLINSIAFYVIPNKAKELMQNFEQYLPYYLEYNEVVTNRSVFASKIEDFYFNGNVSLGILDNITHVTGDPIVTYPMYQALKLQSKTKQSSTYFSYFTYEGTFSFTYAWGTTKYYNVSHGDDMNYLFPMLNNLLAPLHLNNTQNDNIVIDRMTELFGNFVKTGVPEASAVPTWPNFAENQKFMKIGNGKSPDFTIEENFLPDRMQFWEELSKETLDPRYL